MRGGGRDVTELLCSSQLCFAYIAFLCFSLLFCLLFVADAGLGLGHDSENIAAAIVAMGTVLGKTVVAEGVESPDQLAFLRACGCDLAQGFLLGRPAEARTFAQMLASGPMTGQGETG